MSVQREGNSVLCTELCHTYVAARHHCCKLAGLLVYIALHLHPRFWFQALSPHLWPRQHMSQLGCPFGTFQEQSVPKVD